METVTYDKEITALLVIDPYNDFILVWHRRYLFGIYHKIKFTSYRPEDEAETCSSIGGAPRAASRLTAPSRHWRF